MCEVVYSCSKCNKVCKDKKGLTNHENKCNPQERFICKYCENEFATKQNLQRHAGKCDQKEKYELYQAQLKYMKELEEKLLLEEKRYKKLEEDSKHKSKLDNRTNDKLLKEIDTLHAANETYKKEMEQELKKIKEKEEAIQKEYIKLTNKYSVLVDSHNQERISIRNTPAMVINNNSNVHQNSNLFYLKQFDPSILEGFISPPNNLVRNPAQLVDQLVNRGFNNHLRISDRSRKNLVWLDEEGKTVKDSNGVQIVSKVIQTISSEVRSQLIFFEEELRRLQSFPEPDQYRIQEVYSCINFCNGLLNNSQPLIKEVCDLIVKRAKDKSDTSIDVFNPSQLVTFSNHLETILFPEVPKWIYLSFYDIGRYIGQTLKDYIRVEPACLSAEEKYFFVVNDKSYTKRVDVADLDEIVKEVLLKVFVSPQTIASFMTCLRIDPRFNETHLNTLFEWMNDENVSESTKTLMQGIVERDKVRS